MRSSSSASRGTSNGTRAASCFISSARTSRSAACRIASLAASTDPAISAAVLPGITRNSVITLARDLGFTVQEEMLPRELLYIADEAFFAGTAVEITPIKTVDKIAIGSGRRGPVTEALQKAFFAVINGEVPDRHGWLTFVYPGEPLQPATTGSQARGVGR